jgi:hypothetical protein
MKGSCKEGEARTQTHTKKFKQQGGWVVGDVVVKGSVLCVKE